MQDQDNRTDLEKYIDTLEKTIGDNNIILRVVLKTDYIAGYQQIGLEPEGNVEFLNAGDTFELVLVVNKTNPKLRITVSQSGL